MKCFACKHLSSTMDVRSLRIEGWHDVTTSIASDCLSGESSAWLCPKCTKGTVQCLRCDLRVDATAARTGHGVVPWGTVNIKPWTCTGELWEWLCSNCTQPN